MANANKQEKSMVQEGGSQNSSPLTLTVKEYTLTRIADAEIPTAILENGEPFLAWRVLVEEGLKAHWKTQKKKEKDLLEKGVVILTLPFKTNGGIQKMKAINLFDIPAYLYTISANKVRQELREKVKQMQIETTHAIREYWKNKIKKEREEIEQLKEEYNRLVKELREIPTYEEYKELKFKHELMLAMLDMLVRDMEKAKPYLDALFTRIQQLDKGIPAIIVEGNKKLKKLLKVR